MIYIYLQYSKIILEYVFPNIISYCMESFHVCFKFQYRKKESA